MLLGKITLKIEFKNNKWIRCRPVANGKNEPFNPVIGKTHVVYIENCTISRDFIKGNIYTIFGIFSNKVSINDFNESYCKVRVSPISEIVFNQLKTIYKQENHAFSTI